MGRKRHRGNQLSGDSVSKEERHLPRVGEDGERRMKKKRKTNSQKERRSKSTAELTNEVARKPKSSLGVTNWNKLQSTLRKQATETSNGDGSLSMTINVTSTEQMHNEAALTVRSSLTKVLALDCEMVGGGIGGQSSLLARVSIVNSSGDVVYDTFVSPTEKVTDYRTQWSGIRPRDLIGAPPKELVVSQVKSLLSGRIIVGHALQNDLEALNISHPDTHIRDSARYPQFMRRLISGKLKPKALRLIVEEELNMTIQTGEHDSIQDARAVLGLYNKHKTSWESWHSKELRMARKRKVFKNEQFF